LANDRSKEAYEENFAASGRTPKVVGLGLVSAASAIAGGLAVAWWYRKTLTRLQNPIVSGDAGDSKSPNIIENEDSA
jgi:hypothetical protein